MVRILVALLLMAAPAWAGGGVVAKVAVIRAAPEGAPVLAAYVSLTNLGVEEDRLVAVTGDISERIELHEMVMADGETTMQMREVDGGIVVPPQETVILQPGGLHLMIFDPVKGVAPGDKVRLTLEFAEMPEMDVIFEAMSIAQLREFDFGE